MDKEFPFTIRDIAYLLNLYVRHKAAASWDTDCPFCGGKGKLNLNLQKNVFRCNRCGENGGMLALYGKVYGNGPCISVRKLQVIWSHIVTQKAGYRDYRSD